MAIRSRSSEQIAIMVVTDISITTGIENIPSAPLGTKYHDF
jgi:hypothetical protein